MSTEIKYKYLSLGLGILALVFAVLYFTKSNDGSISDIIKQMGDKFGTCEQKLTEWQNTHVTSETQQLSDSDKEDLNNILEQCNAIVRENQERL